MTDLFGDDDDIEDNPELKINTKYMEQFNEKKKKEELSKLSDLQIDDSDSEEEDEAKSEDLELDLKFLDVIQRIRNKDPSIYDPNQVFFPDEDVDKKKQKSNKDKTITVGNYFHSKTFLGDKLEKELDEMDE
jgi:protein KRI1